MRPYLFILMVVMISCGPPSTKQQDSANDAGPEGFYEMKLVSTHGTEITPEKNGKPVLINLWATWCAPCIKEMPSILRLRDKIGDKVDFYLLSYEEPQKINTFEQKMDTGLPLYSYDETQLPADFQTTVIPYTVLLKDGKVVFDKTGSTEWDSEEMVRNLLEIIEATN